MSTIVVNGRKKMYGTIKIDRSKNATLPILAASILAKGKVVIEDVPTLSDVDSMVSILKGFGVEVRKRKNNLYIVSEVKNYLADATYTKAMRSSIVLIGPMLARYKKIVIAYPGGCKIGARPIDIHLDGLTQLGAIIEEKDGYLYCDGSNMHSANLSLRFPSVGATQNLIMASVFLKGKTVINNIAKEPEVIDLIHFLNAMGAKVKVVDDSVEIVGVKSLKGVRYTPIADRIITGTYLIACAIAGGCVQLTHCVPEHVEILIAKLLESGCHISIKDDIITIECTSKRKSLPSITTGVYPAFPTDLQSLYLVLACFSKGTTVIEEKIFENRFGIVDQLKKMGADIVVSDGKLIVKGKRKLKGCLVQATDLRAGAGLVLAGLKAKGVTTVTDIYHIDRGYDHIENQLQMLGADVIRK